MDDGEQVSSGLHLEDRTGFSGGWRRPGTSSRVGVIGYMCVCKTITWKFSHCFPPEAIEMSVLFKWPDLLKGWRGIEEMLYE